MFLMLSFFELLDALDLSTFKCFPDEHLQDRLGLQVEVKQVIISVNYLHNFVFAL